jgi:hypothetical protein
MTSASDHSGTASRIARSNRSTPDAPLAEVLRVPCAARQSRCHHGLDKRTLANLPVEGHALWPTPFVDDDAAVALQTTIAR